MLTVSWALTSLFELPIITLPISMDDTGGGVS